MNQINLNQALNNQNLYSNFITSQNAKENEKKKFSIKDFDIVDKFSSGIKNSSDLNDTVTVPRTIFKGYLAFMAGTALWSLGSFMKKGIMKKGFGITATLLTLYGTWSFVRPYVLKDSQKKQ